MPLKQVLVAALMISSGILGLVVSHIAVRFTNLKPHPPARNIKEYIGYIYGFYPPDVDREAGEKHFRFMIWVQVSVFVISLFSFGYLAYWLCGFSSCD
jgi:hypothetical protein